MKWFIAAASLATMLSPLDAPFAAAAAAAEHECVILQPRDAEFLERLAAREIRRYAYLRTGLLLPIAELAEPLPDTPNLIVVGRCDHPAIARLGGPELARALPLTPSAFLLRTVERGRQHILFVAGGDGAGTLYGAYRLAEHAGVRFFLHGDVIPDEPAPARLPRLDERAAPLFELRGIQPFHDFPEGPDWWSADDYLAVLSQLPKLGMNFFGLHTYPEARPNAEPTVWIGLEQDIDEGAQVRASYPASYMNTLRGNWGYAAKPTGDYSFGAALLFDRDDYGAPVMAGFCPQPVDPEECDELFARAGDMLDQAFRHARALGIRTCVGTETPLVVPERVQARLRAMGKDPADPAVVRELYAGIFRRAQQAYAIDYYWLWTPEGWTWQGVAEAELKATIDDLNAAIAAARQVRAPFTLATCGWVLGPQSNRSLFDEILPPSMPISCINRQVGMEPVDPAFARVADRPKWAIPWLEDDPALTAPQLWVGRMREDAADALRYGCTGLMGIHWRTRALGPNVSALARAAWDQAGWAPAPDAAAPMPPAEGPTGGNYAAFPANAITGTDDAPLYQTVRYDVKSYRFALHNGSYTVTLKFCEPHYRAAGKRVFGAKIQGRQVIEGLDIFRRAGPDRALDMAFPNVAVEQGELLVEFTYEVEMPSIAAILIEGEGIRRGVNCGGPAYADYAADWPAAAPRPRGLPSADFYADWAAHEFGAQAGPAVAAIFASVDGRLPRPADWVDGPGGLRPDPRPWADVAPEYAFVDDLAACATLVKGAGSRERFEYWLDTFQYMRAMARVRCTWALVTHAIEHAEEASDPVERAARARARALPLRRELVAQVADVYRHLLATVTNPGELGTVANWEQHILPGLLTEPGRRLAAALGEPLPPDAEPGKAHAGPPRLIVPTLQAAVHDGGPLRVRALLLAAGPPAQPPTLRWRPLGQGGYRTVPLTHLARGVWEGALALAPDEDIEYYVEAVVAPDQPLRSPALSQTLVSTPR